MLEKPKKVLALGYTTYKGGSQGLIGKCGGIGAQVLLWKKD